MSYTIPRNLSYTLTDFIGLLHSYGHHQENGEECERAAVDHYGGGWDVLNGAFPQSGVTFHEAQVALAKQWIGSDDITGSGDEKVKLERPKVSRVQW